MTESLQGGVVLMNQGMLMGLRAVDDERSDDRFDPFRVGLDHLSFGADSRADLERTIEALDSLGVEHGQINDVRSMDSPSWPSTTLTVSNSNSPRP
jgi:hypothetical protein